MGAKEVHITGHHSVHTCNTGFYLDEGICFTTNNEKGFNLWAT